MRPIHLRVFLMTMLCTGVAAAASPVAYVYVAETSVDETQPVYAYSVASDGKLTPVKGSPFTQVLGLMVGTNGKHFITLGPVEKGIVDAPLNTLYSYEVAPDGAIGQPVSFINTRLFSGADCDAASGAELDHSGKYIYVPYCTEAVQTFKIASSGELTFQNDTIYKNLDQTFGGLPAITGNDAFAFNQTVLEPQDVFGFDGFARKSSGTLEAFGVATVTGPNLPADYTYTFEGGITTDPTDHLAVSLGLLKLAPNTITNEGCVLASFKAGSQGELSSTNTLDDMPAYACGQDILLSPSGKFLAVNALTGVQFFHFNGSEPITKFTGVIGSSGYIAAMAWDNTNHLYALNGVSGKLHVYTVSSTKAVEAAGSPYDLPYCGFSQNTPECPQTIVVRSIP